MNKNLSIKNWSAEDRPREKMLQKGIDTLSNSELIAILIGSGTRTETAVDVAKRILQLADNNLNELGKLKISDFQKVKGIGEAKAINVMAALELGRRRKLAEGIEKAQITSSKDVFDIFHPILADLPHEEFWVVYMNKGNRVIAKERISVGGVAGTVFDLKIIAHKGISLLASSVIMCHNHPSGNTKPSKEDKAITQKMFEAGKILEINMLDHIIITDNAYFSFADEGMLTYTSNQ